MCESSASNSMAEPTVPENSLKSWKIVPTVQGKFVSAWQVCVGRASGGIFWISGFFDCLFLADSRDNDHLYYLNGYRPLQVNGYRP